MVCLCQQATESSALETSWVLHSGVADGVEQHQDGEDRPGGPRTSCPPIPRRASRGRQL